MESEDICIVLNKYFTSVFIKETNMENSKLLICWTTANAGVD